MRTPFTLKALACTVSVAAALGTTSAFADSDPVSRVSSTANVVEERISTENGDIRLDLLHLFKPGR